MDTTIGQRMLIAECALMLLKSGELPLLKNFVFNASFDVQEFASSQRFSDLVGSDEGIKDLLSASRKKAYVKTSMGNDQIRFTLFHQQGFTQNDAVLYARVLEAVTAATYAALGLDMTGLQPSRDDQPQLNDDL